MNLINKDDLEELTREILVINQNRASSRKAGMKQQRVEATVRGGGRGEDAHFPPHAPGEQVSNAQEERSKAAPAKTILSYS